MKRGLILLLCLSLLIPGALFAQGGQEAKDEGPVVIEFWTHEDANRQKLEERYIEEFKATHPDVEVNVTRQSAEKLIELVQTAFAAGSGPTMFNLAINDERPFIDNGLVAPMDYEAAGFADASDVIASYATGSIDPVVKDGEVYGLPLELTQWCIYLNKKVFRDAGLDPDKDYPKTWEDMVELSKKIVQRDGEIITRRGYDFRYKYYLENCVPMVEQLGGQLISDDGTEAIVGKDAWVKFFTFMQNWGPEGLNLGSPTYTPARKLFNKDNGDIAMCSTGLYQEARILNDNPDFYNSGEWMIVPYPKFKDAVKYVPSNYYGHYYMVNASADKRTQKAAWELIGYMLSHGDEYLDQVGLVQPSNALFASDVYQKMPYGEVFKQQMEEGHVVYYGADSSAIQGLLDTQVKAVMLQGVDPEKAYADLKRDVQELIDEQ